MPDWSLINIGSGNGLVPSRAITWASVDLDPWRHMVPLGHNELTYIDSEQNGRHDADGIFKCIFQERRFTEVCSL